MKNTQSLQMKFKVPELKDLFKASWDNANVFPIDIEFCKKIVDILYINQGRVEVNLALKSIIRHACASENDALLLQVFDLNRFQGLIPDNRFINSVLIIDKLLENNKKHLAIESINNFLNITQDCFSVFEYLNSKKYVDTLLGTLDSFYGLSYPVLKKLVLLFVQTNNAAALHILKKNYPERYEACVLDLSEKNKKLEKDLIQYSSPLELSNIFLEFTGFGQLSYTGGCLTIAQENSRKKEFAPTILKEEEWPEYIRILKENSQNLSFKIREKFVLTGSHWVSGAIEVSDGVIALFFLDSLGLEWVGSIVLEFPESFHGMSIFMTEIERQHSDMGCQFFALDDAKKLSTIDHYLNISGGVFSYLSKNIIRQKEFSGITINVCRIPLTFMRTMQSRKLINCINNRSIEEQQWVLNKKGMTAKECYDHDFQMGEKKLQNTRLSTKMKGFSKHNLPYILENTPQKIQGAMYRFTLSGFRERFTSGKVTATQLISESNLPDCDRQNSM